MQFFVLIIAVLALIAIGAALYSRFVFKAVAGEATVGITGTTTFEVDKEYDLTVTANTQGNNILVMAVTLSYPADLLLLEQDDRAAGWAVYGDNGTTPGQIVRMIGATTPLNGDAVPVLTMKFKTLKEGRGTIAFDKVTAAEDGTNEVAMTATNADFTIGNIPAPGSPSPAPPSGAPPKPKSPSPKVPSPTPPTPNTSPIVVSSPVVTDDETSGPAISFLTPTPAPATSPIPATTASSAIKAPYFVKISYTENKVLEPEQKRSKGVLIVGTAHPSSTVNINIASDPIAAKANADDKGNWSTIINDWMTDGMHIIKGVAEKDGQKSTETVYSFTISSQGEGQVALGKKLPEITATPIEPAAETPKDNRNKIILWTLIVLGVIVIGVGGWVWWDKRGKTRSKDSLQMPPE